MCAFVVVSFERTAKGGMRQDVPLPVQGEDQAMRVAQRLSGMKCLVLVLCNELAGDERDVRVLIALGDVPDDLDEIRLLVA